MEDGYHFIVVVEINAESSRATKELDVLLLKVFFAALLLSPGKKQDRVYIGLICPNNIFYQAFENTEHSVDFMRFQEVFCFLVISER